MRHKKLLGKALATEEDDAREALKLFRKFEKSNKLYYFNLLLLAVLGPIIVTALVHFVGHIPLPFGRYIVMAILLGGYFPFYYAYMRREVNRGFTAGPAISNFFWFGAFVFSVILGPVLLLIYVVAVAAIIGLITIMPLRLVIPMPMGEWPMVIQVAIEAVLLLLALGWVFSGIHPPIPRFRYLPGEIIAGLKRNTGEFLGFVSGIVVAAFLVGGGYFNLVYERLWESLLIGSFSGLMMGLSCKSHAARFPSLQSLALLGQARCLIKLGRKADASRRLREISESPPFAKPYPIERIADAISDFEGRWLEKHQNRKYKAQHHLVLADKILKPHDIPETLWDISVNNTWHLIGSESLRCKPPEELVLISRDVNLPAWQRVCAAEVIKEEEDPRFHREKGCIFLAERLLGFVRIPEGQFLAGPREKDGNPEEIFLPTYYISRYPVTIQQIRAYLNSSLSSIDNFSSLQEQYSRPFTSLRWSEAVAYCEWLAGQLRDIAISRLSSNLPDEESLFWHDIADNILKVTIPSEAEWEKAARGVDGRRFPWGNELDPDRVNVAEVGLEEIVPVGCFPLGTSPYGVEDILGTGLSWTRSRFNASLSEESDVILSPRRYGEMSARGTEPFFSIEHTTLNYRVPRSCDHPWGAGLRIVLVTAGIEH